MTDVIVVCGATGRQGGSVTRSLVQQGRTVRAMTRKPDGDRARAIADVGAEVVRADMDDPASLRRAFEGATGVYSVQSGIASGFDAEVRQGRNVADAAEAAGVRHFVYASAGFGRTTGVPSWDSKLPIEARVRDLGTAWTILRPLAFMELMSDPKFYPAVGTWRIFPKLTGPDRPIPWLSVEDLGVIAAKVFAEPDTFSGREITLASDVRTLAECRATYHEVMGRSPRTFPMPLWLFDRFTRGDPTTMWRWLRTGEPDLDTAATRAVHPSAMTVKQWMVQMRQPSRTSAVKGGNMAHANVERLRSFLDAYAGRDAERIRDALAPDAVWHVGGTHRFSGDYRGVEEIVEYFDRVGAETGGTLRLEPLELLANDERGAAFLHVTAERDGRGLDVTMAEAFHFDTEGRIREFWAHATDQAAVDTFWRSEQP